VKVEKITKQRIGQYLREGMPKTEMVKELRAAEDVPEFGIGDNTFDSDRTKLNRYIKRIEQEKTPDTSGPWLFASTKVETTDPANARHVLDLLAYVIELSDRRITELTNLEAEWIIRLRQARPEMPEKDVWELVRGIIDYSSDDRQRLHRHVQGVLAFQPWRSDEDRQRFNRYVMGTMFREFGEGMQELDEAVARTAQKRDEKIARRKAEQAKRKQEGAQELDEKKCRQWPSDSDRVGSADEWEFDDE
jgi:hypothetical protein